MMKVLIFLFGCYRICAGQSEALVNEYVTNITELIENANNWTYSTDASSYLEGYNGAECRDEGTYDFIIVGAGSTGCVIANRLTEISGWRVLLLEAGVRENNITDIPYLADYLRTTDYNWGYVTTTQKHLEGYINQSSLYPAGKALGGSSVINSMMYVRGNKADYNKWAAQGNPGWSYEDVLPYFKKSEHANFAGDNDGYHGTNGTLNVEHVRYYDELTLAFLESQKELGRDCAPDFDYNGANQMGCSLLQLTTLNGSRDSAARAFILPAQNRPNLNISLDSYVLKILIHEHRKTAYGVKFLKNGQCHCVRASKEVILSAGTIQSPHLLMLSGVGPKEQLEEFGIPVIQDLSVGDNFWNHEAYAGQSFRINHTITDNGTRADVIEYLNGQGIYTAPGGVQGVGFVNLEDSHSSVPLIEYLFRPTSSSNPTYQANKNLYGYNEDTFENVLLPQSNVSTYLVLATLLHPESRGYVRLKSSSPLDYPLINPKDFSKQIDLERLVVAMRDIERFVNTTALKKYGAEIIPVSLDVCKNYTWNSDEYWRCMISSLADTIHHYGGTCKMGPSSDEKAVVDHKLRVYGIKNLRVADCSVIPVTLSGHTNAPAMMIGEKASLFIKEDHQFPCNTCYSNNYNCSCDKLKF